MTRYQHGWPNLCHMTEEILSHCLAHIDSGIETVINFGVFCGETDYRSAKKFPSVSFIGVDREAATKKLNDAAYTLKNLSFVQADIMNFLPVVAERKGVKLLFHARTATLLYPNLLLKIYKSCATAGIQYIALYENFSLSRSTFLLHDFDSFPAQSVPYAETMFIHNYRQFLEETGYEMIEFKKLPYADLIWHHNPEVLADSHISLVARLK